MKLQQLIKELMELEQLHGNLFVEFEDYDEITNIYWPIAQVTLSDDKKVVILK